MFDSTNGTNDKKRSPNVYYWLHMFFDLTVTAKSCETLLLVLGLYDVKLNMVLCPKKG